MHRQHISVASQQLSFASTINTLGKLLSKAKLLICLSFCVQFHPTKTLNVTALKEGEHVFVLDSSEEPAHEMWTHTRARTHTLQSSAFKTAHKANPDKVRLHVRARLYKNTVTGLDRNAHLSPCTWCCLPLSRHVRCIEQIKAPGNLSITYEQSYCHRVVCSYLHRPCVIKQGAIQPAHTHTHTHAYTPIRATVSTYMTRSNGSLVRRTGQKIDQWEPQTQCGQRVSSRSFLPQRHLHTAVPRVRHRRLQGPPAGCEIFCSVRNLAVCLRKRCDAAAARSDPGQR